MQPFVRHTGLVCPLDRLNVDTDQIVPKQFLKRIERSGYGQFLFYDWRFTPEGEERPDFVLNQPRYRNATILLTRRNFGSGSSREHAVWAVQDYGFRAIIAPSFADIFYNNCFQNGVLPVVLKEEEVDELFRRTYATEGYRLTVDLEAQEVRDDQGLVCRFEIDPYRKHKMLNGLDAIAETLLLEDKIREYEARRPARFSLGR